MRRLSAILIALAVGAGCAHQTPPAAPSDAAIRANTSVDQIDAARLSADDHLANALKRLKQ